MERRTKIVATIGPASDSESGLASLFDAGVDVVRLNLAHGAVEEHVERIHRVRKVAAEIGRTVAVLTDLPGPKVRTAPFPEGGVVLAEGDRVDLVASGDQSSGDRIVVDYADLCAAANLDDTVMIGDGATTLAVEECHPDRLVARVVSGGSVQGRPGVHLPTDRLRLATPTDDDLRLLEVVAGAGVDFVAVSFVRSAADVVKVRDALGGAGPRLIAKIETRPAVADLDAIMDAADALMVARGDLGADYPIEEVPHLQKRIIRSCVAWGLPVITATQMLESMIEHPMPTRAEASDVANAVFDGTDAVMLSGETAIGRDPPNVVRTMVRIVSRAEAEADYLQWGRRLGRLQRAGQLGEGLAITAATTHAAWEAAVELGAAAVLCCTRSGLTARAMARFRPPGRLVGISPDEATVRQLTLSWGVEPLPADNYTRTDEMVWFAVEAAVKAGVVKEGDIAVVLAGAPEDPTPTTDVVRIVRVR